MLKVELAHACCEKNQPQEYPDGYNDPLVPEVSVEGHIVVLFLLLPDQPDQ